MQLQNTILSNHVVDTLSTIHMSIFLEYNSIPLLLLQSNKQTSSTYSSVFPL